MTRAEYFTHLRAALLELDDRTMGIFLWHCVGPFPHVPTSIPEELTILELYNRLFPVMTPEWGAAKVGANPSAASLQRSANRSSTLLTSLKGGSLKRYESALLAIGQRARDLIQGDSTALWNVREERRRQLDREWASLDGYATQAEHTAMVARQRADTVRAELDSVLVELERLAQIKNSSKT